MTCAYRIASHYVEPKTTLLVPLQNYVHPSLQICTLKSTEKNITFNVFQ